VAGVFLCCGSYIFLRQQLDDVITGHHTCKMINIPRSTSEDHNGFISHTSYRREILKTIRHVENRLCADCSAVIGNLPMIYASTTHGVWICETCASIHKEWDVSSIKTSAEEWSEDGIHFMSSHTNERVNNVLERYIPYGLQKCTTDSSKSDKEWWILAKYNSRLFMLPGENLSPAIIGASSSLGVTNILPTRLVDFFLTISIGKCEEFGMNMSGFKLSSLHFSADITGCVPDVNRYPDTEIPNRLGDFVFPNGIGLTTEESSPFFFTFVLTDVSAVKLYGAVLQISELFEPEDYPSVLGHAVGSPDLPELGLVYAPKALVLVSHYPFFYLFQCILEQLYRISLSSCPLPIDRYVVNMLEVPLPPRGCVDVSYCSLADCTLTISRPPSNQLPMIDFSFRPLFGCLSVDNILLVYSFLMNEHKVCFASDNISLLTPVQEALLALLFPLVWQGAYIPVLPSHMMDILEAPVPLIVGIDKKDFPNFGKEFPEGCATVDLDLNFVHIGIDYSTDLPLIPLELPSREFTKLKAKLIEVGECIRRSPDDVHGARLKESLRQAGHLFPNKEHLVPMDKFFTEDGVTLAKPNHEEHNYYLSDTDSKVQVPYQCTISSRRSSSILCPANNANMGDGFDAKEIRYAFLRFFLSIFRDFQQYIEDDADSTSSSTSTSTTKKKKNSFGSIGRFSRDSFLNAHTGHFFANL
jgi:DENN domain-containing protein 5